MLFQKESRRTALLNGPPRLLFVVLSYLFTVF